MATQPQDEGSPAKPMRIADSTGETVTLDAEYFRRAEEARRARLTAPPLSEGELAHLREQYPEQAWYWTREWQEGEREADEDIDAGRCGPIYDSDEELQATLDRIPPRDADV